MKRVLAFLLFCSLLSAERPTLFLEADFLYWSPGGFRAPGDQFLGIDSHYDVKVFTPKSVYYPGFRLALFGKDCCSDFSFGVSWSRVHGNSTNPQTPCDCGWIYTIYSSQFVFNPLYDFSGTHTVVSALDYLDFDFSSSFSPSSFLTLTPHMGVRFLWFTDSSKLHLAGVAVGDSVDFNGQAKEQLFGAGIEGGIGATTTRCRGFAFFGHLGAALLRSKKEKSEDWSFYFPDFSTRSFFSSRRSDLDLSFNLSGTLGIEYALSLCSIRLAWEQFYLGDLGMGWSGISLGGEVCY